MKILGCFIFMLLIGSTCSVYAEPPEMALNRAVLNRVKGFIKLKATGREQGTFYLFSDPDCGPCQVVHRDLTTIRARGWTVNFGFEPLSNGSSPSMDRVLCAAKREEALLLLYEHKPLATVREKSRCHLSAESQGDRALEMGASGAPVFVFSDGFILNGYPGIDTVLDLAAQHSLVH